MSKKISFEQFANRFHQAHPDDDVEFEGYTAISKPITVICQKCKKRHYYQNCNRAISGYHCCVVHSKKINTVKKWLDDSHDFDFISELSCEEVLVKHRTCGNIVKKNIQKFFTNPTSCPHCNTRVMKNKNNITEAQEVLDKTFFGELTLLEYNGRHETCRYRCEKCGQIFTQKFDCLLGSAGCPKCDRKKSQGEIQIKQLLSEKNIIFKEQYGVPELHKQRFDFAVFDNKGQLSYVIEVQGEQHFYSVKRWGGEAGLMRRKQLDAYKREWCEQNNITMYELIYTNKKIQNIDILPL